MIKTLKIRNFMSHEETLLEFDPLINIIIGETDAGKSVIFRALEAVLNNTFTSKAISHDKDFFSIQATTEKATIELYRGKSSYYKINYFDGQPNKKFESVGRSIPLEVIQAMNMPALVLDEKEEIEVLRQSQHDPFFLINEGRAILSKIMGKVSNLDLIFDKERLVNSDILNTQLANNKLLAIREAHLEDYKQTEAKLKEVLKFKSIEASILKVQQAETSLASLISDHSVYTQNSAQFIKLSEILKIPSISTSFEVEDFDIIKEAFSITVSPAAKKVSVPTLDFLDLDLSCFYPLPNKLEAPSLFEDALSIRNSFENLFKAEEALRVKRLELESINIELDSFSYCVYCGKPK